MKIVYTDQAYLSLDESLRFLLEKQGLPLEKVLKLRKRLLDKADRLTSNPYLGQFEEYLNHLNKNHRRLVFEYYKIIYRIEDETIYITDFFDTRQDPEKMKG